VRPEKQDMAIFADGMDNIVSTHQRVAEGYFADGSVEMACPPLKGLLHIMARGNFEGRDVSHPEFRALFKRESVMESAWYAERLKAKQTHDIQLWRNHATYLENFLKRKHYADEAVRLGISGKLEKAWETYHKVKSAEYLTSLKGTIGRQPLAG